jgi:FHA domain
VSFTILRVTQRAHGGDPIERTKRITGNEATIGRGTDCDLQLPDLTIALRHAIMRITGPGRITIEVIGNHRFEQGGNLVRHAELRVSENPSVSFASYVLTFGLGETPEDIVVSVEQTATDARDSDTSLAKKAFSLGSIMFSLRAAAWLLGIAILLAALAAPIAYHYLVPGQPRINPNAQWSPGPLSAGHAFLEKNCEACHVQAFRTIPDEACLSCHRNGLDAIAASRLAERVADLGSPLSPHPANDHAEMSLLRRAKETPVVATNPVISAFDGLFAHPTERCISCHTDHVGSAGQRPSALGPAHPTPAQVTEADCATCHENLKAHIPDTALLDVRDWDHHPDFRPLIATLAENGRPKFESDTVADGPFDTGLKFSHKQHLAAGGDVARQAAQYGEPAAPDGRLSCSACHHPDKDGRGFLPIEMTRDCASCHSLRIQGIGGQTTSLPHGEPAKVVATMVAYYKSGGDMTATTRMRPGGAFQATTSVLSDAMIAQKVRAVFMDDTTEPHPCYGCHTFKAPADPNSLVFRIAPVHVVNRYLPRSGFDHSVPQHLVDANGKPLCLNCHMATSSDSLSNVVIPSITACKACHGAKSGLGQEVAASNCTECHGYHSTGEPPTREPYLGPWRFPSGM